MNYEYGEPYLEITFKNGYRARLKKSAITEIYEYVEDGKTYVKVYVQRVDTTMWYLFTGPLEEFDKRCKTIYI